MRGEGMWSYVELAKRVRAPSFCSNQRARPRMRAGMRAGTQVTRRWWAALL